MPGWNHHGSNPLTGVNTLLRSVERIHQLTPNILNTPLSCNVTGLLSLTKALHSQKYVKYFSTNTNGDGTLSSNLKSELATIEGKDLNPNYIVGFIDAEGSFNISISKDENRTTGFRVVCEIHITQKAHSAKILYAIKDYFGCGVVKVDNKNTDGLKYQLSSFIDINRVLIPFLEKHPLLTSKYLNYLSFKKAIEMVLNREHLTAQGIERLKTIAQEMNTKRTFKEKWEFCQEHCSKSLITPEWVQGFTDGEGCFYFFMGKQKINKEESSTWLLQASNSPKYSRRGCS